MKEGLIHLYNNAKTKLSENRGMGTIEIVLIIIVLVSLAVIFRSNITNIFNGLMNNVKDMLGDWS